MADGMYQSHKAAAVDRGRRPGQLQPVPHVPVRADGYVGPAEALGGEPGEG